MSNRTFYIILALWFAFLLIMFMTGCRTKTVTVHDTVSVVQHDTLTKYAVKERTDTLKLIETNTITVNQEGDTVRVVVYRDRWRDRVQHDTITVYRVAADAVVHEAQRTERALDWRKAVFFAFCGVFLSWVVNYTVKRF